MHIRGGFFSQKASLPPPPVGSGCALTPLLPTDITQRLSGLCMVPFTLLHHPPTPATPQRAVELGQDRLLATALKKKKGIVSTLFLLLGEDFRAQSNYHPKKFLPLVQKMLYAPPVTRVRPQICFA